MTASPFTADSAAFLRDLSENNDRDWYRANLARYHRALLEPCREFVTALGDELRRRVHPGIVGEPKVDRGIRRLARDVRFARDKTPFKTEQTVILSWSERRFAPGFQVALGVDGVELAAGRRGWDAPQRTGFRAALLDERGLGFRGVLAVCEGAGFVPEPPELKGYPRGAPRSHPNAEFLRYAGGFRVRRRLDVALEDPQLVRRCADALILAGPLVAWLDTNTRDQSASASSIAATEAACASAEDGP
ncbi:MAG: DUF2461 family protein [Proteobacteria bacterium]|nr:DUF2461 family protein [Pseudomonadota bacterium]MCP4916600.1 DUF2461 family protein [Pseudomonadota bacterium]